MSIKENTYKKAFELKRTMAKERQAKETAKLNAAYGAVPRLKAIDRELSHIGASLAMTALEGDTKTLNILKQKSSALAVEKKLLLDDAGVAERAYDCPVCEDTGYVSGKICRCIKELAKKLLYSELSSKMPLESCRFDNFNLEYYPNLPNKDGVNPRRFMAENFNLCRDYVANFNPSTSKSLLFLGETGLGKTHLTLAIISGVIEKGYMPVYGPAADLFSAVEREKFNGGGAESYDAMISCDLLAIDDLGTELKSAFNQSVLYNLINTRLLSKKPTIINTNLSMFEIKDRYAARVASRLIGEFDANGFYGDDIRQLKKMIE